MRVSIRTNRNQSRVRLEAHCTDDWISKTNEEKAVPSLTDSGGLSPALILSKTIITPLNQPESCQAQNLLSKNLQWKKKESSRQ